MSLNWKVAFLAALASFSHVAQATTTVNWDQNSTLPVSPPLTEDTIFILQGDVAFTPGINWLAQEGVVSSLSPMEKKNLSFTSSGSNLFSLKFDGGDWANQFHGVEVDTSIDWSQDDLDIIADLAGISSVNSRVDFAKLKNVTFANNGYQEFGGAINSHFSYDPLEEKGFWSMFYPYPDIAADTSVVFKDIAGKILFDSNASGYAGGAIHSLCLTQGDATAEVRFENVAGGIVFSHNVTDVFGVEPPIAKTWSGGAIRAVAASLLVDGETVGGVTFKNVQGGVSFIENRARSAGGAIQSNSSSSRDGSVSGGVNFSDITGDILFLDNQAGGDGGAIDSRDYCYNENITNPGVNFKNVKGNIRFEGNHITGLLSTGKGGALHITTYSEDVDGNHVVTIGLTTTNVQGDILFLNNSAVDRGGAIFAEADLTLSADGGNIVFQGNTEGRGDAIVANGIHMTDISPYAFCQLRANDTRTIYFYDPLVMEWGRNGQGGVDDVVLHLNEGAGYTGTILFSGAKVADYIAKGASESDSDYNARLKKSKESIIKQKVYQDQGILRMEYGASLEVDTFTYTDGFVKTRNSGLLKTVTDASLDHLKTDVKGYLVGEEFPLALEVGTSGTGTLTGSIFMLNRDGDIYTTPGMLNPAIDGIALITLATDVTDYSGFSLTPEGATSGGKYGAQGYWTMEWIDSAPAGSTDDVAHTLMAYWHQTGFIIDPADLGNGSENSLWSSKTNLNAFTTGATEQMGLNRFLICKNENYWVMGLGDFSSERSSKGIDGYDYWGGGYAVGADGMVSKNFLVGIAFGQIFGTNQNRDYWSTIHQNSLMGMVYSSYFQKLDETNFLRYEGTLGYGSTSNVMNTKFRDGSNARGKWDNDSLEATLRLNWDILMDNKTWVLTPFIGLEYNTGSRETFTETGSRTRWFGSSRLNNLAMPVGVEASKTYTLSNGMTWDNSIALSYVPDVYRENPEAAAHFVEDTNVAWDVYSIRPTRNTGRLDIFTRLHLNKKWAVYAGYQLDAHNNGVYQRCNLGVSCTF